MEVWALLVIWTAMDGLIKFLSCRHFNELYSTLYIRFYFQFPLDFYLQLLVFRFTLYYTIPLFNICIMLYFFGFSVLTLIKLKRNICCSMSQV